MPKEKRAFRVLCVHNGREILDIGQDPPPAPGYNQNPFAPRDPLGPSRLSDKAMNIFGGGPIPRNDFAVQCASIELNATSALGPAVTRYYIEPYENKKKISELSLYPIEYGPQHVHPTLEHIDPLPAGENSTPLWNALQERGKRYYDLVDAKHAAHCEYRGMTADAIPEMVCLFFIRP